MTNDTNFTGSAKRIITISKQNCLTIHYRMALSISYVKYTENLSLPKLCANVLPLRCVYGSNIRGMAKLLGASCLVRLSKVMTLRSQPLKANSEWATVCPGYLNVRSIRASSFTRKCRKWQDTMSIYHRRSVIFKFLHISLYTSIIHTSSAHL